MMMLLQNPGKFEMISLIYAVNALILQRKQGFYMTIYVPQAKIRSARPDCPMGQEGGAGPDGKGPYLAFLSLGREESLS
jgi:hypothetical protein